MHVKIDVSYIVAIYKSQNATVMLNYIAKQITNLSREIIIVSDFAPKETIEEISQFLINNNIAHNIIYNEKNLGSSISHNNGAKVARGKYLIFVDYDDLIPNQVEQKTFDLIEKTGSDLLYGKTYKIDNKDIEEYSLDDLNRIADLDHLTYQVIENNILNFVITKTRVAATYLMVRRDLFDKCCGCDERVNVQDVSMFLRLALYAKKFIYCDNILFFFRKNSGGLSSNIKSCHIDGFNAQYLFLNDNLKKIAPRDANIIKKSLISSLWKMQKGIAKTSLFNALKFLKISLFYITTKLGFELSNQQIARLRSEIIQP